LLATARTGSTIGFEGGSCFRSSPRLEKWSASEGAFSLADERQPKYINTPETAVYHKSQVLYGLYPARRAIRAAREVYVVEGYTDVIAMHQIGVENAVAACGTSLTPDHVRIIQRYADSVVFMNDSDVAGDASNQRSVDLALDQQTDALRGGVAGLRGPGELHRAARRRAVSRIRFQSAASVVLRTVSPDQSETGWSAGNR
jgi:DNA primase catalytic core